MVSEEGWVSDEAIFAKINTNLGEGYSWSSGPVLAGGGFTDTIISHYNGMNCV